MVGAAVVATVLVVGGATGPSRHGATSTTPTGVPLGAVSEVSVRTVAPRSGAPAAVSKIGVGAGAPASVTVTTDRSKPAQRTITIRREDPNGRGGSTGAQLPCDRSPACAVIDQLTSR